MAGSGRAGSRSSSLLGYPLKPDALFAMVLLTLLASALFYAADTLGAENRGDATLWVILHWTGVTLFLALLFEYGLLILDRSLQGSEHPPALDFAVVGREVGGAFREMMGGFDVAGSFRLVKQQIMVMAFLGLSRWLDGYGLSALAWLVTACFVVFLPASLGINFIHGRFLDLLNPLKLAAFIGEHGISYLVTVVCLLLAHYLFTTALFGSQSLFFVRIAAGLYCSVLMFRALGNSIYRNRHRYFQEVDFKADREALAQVSKQQAYLDRKLRKLLNLVKNRRVEEASEKLHRFLDSYEWRNIGEVFPHVAQWPDKTPALSLCRRYIADKVEARDYMGALSLSQWCLKQDISFTLESSELVLKLADYASIKVQYRVAVRLLLNLADSLDRADGGEAGGQHREARRRVLSRAAQICCNDLQDEQRHAQIMALLDQVPGRPD